jgi:hypothetical protein
VEALKAKLKGPAATKGKATTRRMPQANGVELGAGPRTSPRVTVGTVSVRGRLDLAGEAAGWLRESAFDVGFAAVLALWGIGLGLALTVGAQWWFFVFCLAATAALLLFGLFDSPA